MKTYNLSLLVFAIFICFSMSISAQNASKKFGNVTKGELEMKEYKPDPNAEAVVLFDYGVITFRFDLSNNEWRHDLKRTCRIKILNDDGYNWATESISLYKSGGAVEEIASIKGTTYNLENGKIVKTKLTKGNIFKEKTSDKYTRVKFELPNVKEGSIVEFSYTIGTNLHTILDPWYFQKTIPVKWSEYVVNIPEYFGYVKNSTGFENFFAYETSSHSRTINWTSSQRPDSYSGRGGNISSHKIDYNEDRIEWIAKDLPALKDESFVGNHRNYMQKVDFQLSTFRWFDRPKKMY